MKQTRRIRRCWLRIIPEWMKCFLMFKAERKKLKAEITRKIRNSVSSFKSAFNFQFSALKSGLRSHTKEWAAAALAAGLVVAPYSVDISPTTLNSELRTQNCLAAPEGGVVVGGTATIQHQADVTTISQTSQRAAIDWTSFDIAKNETVNFQQPGSNSVALNRIIGNNASSIYGHLNANGQVYLANMNGILFAPGSEINVAGLIATTSRVDAERFMQSGTLDTSQRNAVIEARGNIFAAGGLVQIQGASAINQTGIIKATNIAAGSGGLITIENSENITISGTLDASALQPVGYSPTAYGNGGRISVVADKRTGTLDVSGAVLTATATTQGGDGGMIEVSAAYLRGLDTLSINAAAGAKGQAGSLLIDPNDFHIVSGASTWIIGNTIGNQTLNSILNTGGADVTVATTGLGGDLYVDSGATVTWTANSSLALSASRNIFINDNIINSAGTGNVTLRADGDAVGNGQVNFGTGNKVYLNPASSGGSLYLYYYPTCGNYDVSNRIDYSANFSGNNAAVYMLLDKSADYMSLANNQGYCTNASVWTGSNFALGADMDFSGSIVNTIGIYGYAGKFDGLNHTLSNLGSSIGSDESFSVFGTIDVGATVANLVLASPNAEATMYGDAEMNLQGIVATTNAGLIDNVTISDGSIIVFSDCLVTNWFLEVYAGGIAGQNDGVIRNCSISGLQVTGATSCGDYANVVSYVYAGGIAGLNNGSVLGGVFSGLNVSGGSGTYGEQENAICVGGIAGVYGGPNSTISGVTLLNSSISGNNSLSGKAYIGGIVGTNNTGAILDCVLSGVTVSGSNVFRGWGGDLYIGGIVGSNGSGTVLNSQVSNGLVSGAIDNHSLCLGGVIGSDVNGTIIGINVTNETLVATSSGTDSTCALNVAGSIAQGSAGASYRDTRISMPGAAFVNMNYTDNGDVLLGLTGGAATVTQNNESSLSIGASSLSGALTMNASGLLQLRGPVNAASGNISAAGVTVFSNFSASGAVTLSAFGSQGTAGVIGFGGGIISANTVSLTARPLAGMAMNNILTTLPNGLFGTYTINDYGDLINASNDLSSNASYALNADIDCSGLPFLPIGSQTSLAFSGNFNGAGYKIMNLTINDMWDENVGFFTEIASGATVSNLTLANETITNTNLYNQTNVGGIAGINNGLISNVVISGGNISGQLTSGSAGGGIVGSNYGSLVACTVSGITVSEAYAGGLAGINQGLISSAVALNITASGNMDIGGIAGFNGGTITASTINVGSLSGGLVGGIAGFNRSTVSAASSLAVSVTGMYVGGLIGKNEGQISYGHVSGGTVTGVGSNVYAGGAVGYDLGEVNSVTVSAERILTGASASALFVGGVIGTPSSRYSGSDTRIFASSGDIQLDYTSGGNIVAGITGNNNMVVRQTGESSFTFGPTVVAAAGGISMNAPGSNVFQTGAITSPAVVIDTGNGNITLTNASNQIDALQIMSAAAVNVFDSEDIVLGIGSAPMNVSSIGVTATGNVAISAGTQINASGEGPAAIVLASIDKHFYNAEGSDALNATGGSYLVYSKSPTSDIVNGLAYDFVQYNATLGSVLIGEGNGLIYSCSPQLSGSLGGYAIKKVNGTKEVSNPEKLQANISSGTINNDSVVVVVQGAVYDTPDIGIRKLVTLTTGSVTAFDGNKKPVYGYTVAPNGVTGSVGVIYGQDVLQPIIAIQGALLTQTENQTRAGNATDNKQLLDEQVHNVSDGNVALLQPFLKLEGDAQGNVLALPVDAER